MNHSTFSYTPFSNGGICVAVAAPDVQSAVSSVRPVLDDVDVVEIRLDAMREIDIKALCRRIDRPLLFTNRPEWEGGAFHGPEKERLKLLVNAVQHNPDFIDLELKAAQKDRARLLDKIKGSKTRFIISHHNFDRTPDSATLSAILKQQVESGAHIGKIVTMAHDYFDVLRVLNLQCEAKEYHFPLIAFCMGEAGKISRIITLLLGGFMTYAALGEKQATAPGQLSVKEIKASLSCLAKQSCP